MPRSTAIWTAWTLVRLVAAVVVVAAIVAQGISTIGGAAASGQHVPTAAANFFSYFTILSNAAAAVVLGWSALARVPRRARTRLDPRGLTTAFAFVTTYMLITGVVYNVLLRAVSIGPDTVGWANEVMHVGVPLLLLLDLLVGPGHRMLRWRAAVGAVVFPLAWITYTMLRAPAITAPASGAPSWYPYPFLDPYGPAGWTGVWTYIAAIAAGIILMALGVVAVLRVRARRIRPGDTPVSGDRPRRMPEPKRPAPPSDPDARGATGARPRPSSAPTPPRDPPRASGPAPASSCR